MGLFEKLKNRKICKNEGEILCVLSGYFSVIERVCVLEAQNGRKMGVYFLYKVRAFLCGVLVGVFW